MKTKRALRQQLIQKRNSLKPQEQSNFSQQICNNILSHKIFNHSKNIAMYYALGNEVDLSELYNKSPDKLFYLPVIGQHNSMVFKQYQNFTDLTPNKLGILEPLSGQIIKSTNIEMCLLPLLGFNRQGARLGMGGGYYDRYFQHKKEHKSSTILAGVAYDFQEDDTIFAESWDIPLDMIFTNNEIIIT